MPPEPVPWTRVRVGPRKDFQVLRVGEDTFADPRDRAEHARAIVDADDWCNIVPLTTSGEVVMVRQFRVGSREISLELPGGVVDHDEDPATAAARELEEETGYRAERVLPLGVYSPNPAHFTNRVHAFVGLRCASVHAGTPDASEDLATELIAPATVARYMREGRITHGLILATLGLALLEGYIYLGMRQQRRAAR